MLAFPFRPLTAPVTVQTPDHRDWWVKKGRYPIAVELNRDTAQVSGSLYQLTPKGVGYTCLRPRGAVPLGEIYEYGVRNALTNTLFQELSAIRAVVWGSLGDDGSFVPKSCPAPLCYEMPNGDLVHPGPCFATHESAVIRKTRYNLTENSATVCSVCHERFV